MKFAEHLLAHITPEWRRQYIVYEDMKTMLYEAIENMPTLESAAPDEIERLTRAFDEDFLTFCEKELFKINVFYEEKLAEAKRKFDTLRKELDALALDAQQQSQQHRLYGQQRFSIGRLVGANMLQQQDPTSSFKSTINLRQRQSILSSRRQSAIISNLLPAISTGGGVARTHQREMQISSNPQYHQQQQQQQQVAFSNRPAQIHGGGGGSGSSSTKTPPMLAYTHLPAQNYRNYGSLDSPKSSSSPSLLSLSSSKRIDRRKLNDLKLAFSEFYLSLVLLQNYQRLNFTGFRKIFKKHDKLIGNENGKRWHQAHVECAFFHTNQDVNKLIEETENIVTYQLESGDRQRAMKRLRVPPLNDTPKPWTAFRVGFSLGAFVVLLVAVVLTGLFHQTGDDWQIVFRLYRSSLFIIFFIFLVGINIYGWRAHGVNHVLIFELDPRDHLGGQDLLEIAFSFGLLWCISVLLFLWSGNLGIPPLLNPIILNTIMMLYLLNPFRTFHYTARYWFICCVWRVAAAPFYRVRFSDFWLADQLNSLVPVLLDVEYASCFYLTSTDLYGGIDYNLDRCVVREPKDLIIRAIVACLPAWWRFAQCVRRYFDEGHRAHPHLTNAGKYATVWLVVVFSTLTGHYEEYYQETKKTSPFFILWIVSLVISSCYTYVWDVKMDWGLFDSKAPPEYKFLREELVYPVKWYYLSIIQDFVLRFGWTLNLSLTRVGAIPTDIITLVFAPLEIIRRFVWNFYRLENEHLNNCGEFRAVRDISISGQNIDMSALNRILSIMDEPDGLTAFRSRVKAQLAAAKKKALMNDVTDPSVVLVI